MAKNPLDSINQQKTAGEIIKQVTDLNIVSVPFDQKEEIKNKKKELKPVSPIFKRREIKDRLFTNVPIDNDILNILKQNILNETIKTGSHIKLKDYVNNILENYINSRT
jgi:hypothetical protein